MTLTLLLKAPRIPQRVRQIFHTSTPPICPEQNLWREVAIRAVLDAIGATDQSEPDKHERVVREARVWFRFLPEDVQQVFDLAGLPHEGIGDSLSAVQPYNMGEVRHGEFKSVAGSQNSSVPRSTRAAKARKRSAMSRAKRKRLARA